MSTARIPAETVSETRTELGEGPIWDEISQRLVWIDISGKQLLVTNPTTGQSDSVPTPSQIGAVALRATGGFLAALEDGLYVADDTNQWILLAGIESDDSTTRLNEGKCDPHGAFVGGTMAIDDRQGTASLYRVNGAGLVECLLRGLTISNGLEWTADGATMYHIDTPTRAVKAYRYDSLVPDLGQPTQVVEVPKGQGYPDGMTLDSEGCLWVALWDGRAVHRYTPDGTLDTVIELPVSRVTSCTFGGANLDTLFITTASYGLDDEAKQAQPEAGALFAASVGVSGFTPSRFSTRRAEHE